ncbi:hypothetical protein [Flaviflexus huanghaiensis]|uniref:hypothetical protein n=1 Tax=Flaviflexus huanghaiensis TaxID=1111473 RepID=UPI0015FD71D0|nr:hypothetical protein [Flaviflexus huanghaiensis]
MTRRAGLSIPAFLLSTAIGIAVFILAMLVIGVRIDTGPTLPPAPSAAEQTRQNAASAYSLVADAAEGADPELARLARSHEEAVGGVWVPWPEGAPDGATNPPSPTTNTEDVVELLDQSVAATIDALEVAAPADVPLYASILIRQQAALESAAASAESAPEEPGDGDVDEGSDGEDASESSDGEQESAVAGLTVERLSPGQVATLASEQTLIEMDAARQWLETAAPHLDSPDRALLWIGQVDEYTSAVLQAGTADVRLAFATLPDWFLESPSPETALRLEQEAYLLVASELFTYIPTTDRSFDIQIAATALDLLTGSELDDLPLLTEPA